MRRIALSMCVAAALSGVGCLKYKDELLVMPDGSGRFTMTVSVSEADLKKLGGAAPVALIDEGILNNAEGIVAFSKPVDSTKDGWRTASVTAYFEDITKVRWNQIEITRTYAYGKDGEGRFLEIAEELQIAEDPSRMPPEYRKTAWNSLKKIFDGLEIERKVTMPGKVKSGDAHAPEKAEGRDAVMQIKGSDILTPDDYARLRSRKTRIACGKDEVTPAEVAAFRAELQKAKEAWPKIKEELFGAPDNKEK